MKTNLPLLLGSNSPRRKQLLEECGYIFETCAYPVEETVPQNVHSNDAAHYLAKLKIKSFERELLDFVVITADTTVILNDKVLDKPTSEHEAFQILQEMSGKEHAVITGFCIGNKEKIVSGQDTTLVMFDNLEEYDINRYIQSGKPFDKAGGYGIQDDFGMRNIKKITGSYYTVVGLPVHLISKFLKSEFGITP